MTYAILAIVLGIGLGGMLVGSLHYLVMEDLNRKLDILARKEVIRRQDARSNNQIMDALIVAAMYKDPADQGRNERNRFNQNWNSEN